MIVPVEVFINLDTQKFKIRGKQVKFQNIESSCLNLCRISEKFLHPVHNNYNYVNV